ncbi:3'(2'),5'-bisphosphate nucleotidase CysQ [Aquimarina pacifica]|uniref:3'(2'),5'-bisphosphate nucleotidase CysQ n=1 Tax=Aquimarina pacifica TaxID=1296415 RepID=UPI0004BB5A02|nr:3'(2'),5'-bisphosphate nucleotidase CysQ [Aquimarina pacifica]
MINDIDLLKTAIAASIEAGKEILKIYKKDFKIDYKEDQSPLTEADTASNEVIMSFLKDTGIPAISEENKQLPYADRREWNRCWIVDPIDGTKEFIKRNGEFTVNIALLENGKTLFGVIYVPVTGECYYTNENKTLAYKTILRDFDKTDHGLFLDRDKINKSETSAKEIKVVGSRSHMNDDTEEFVKKLKEKYEDVVMVAKGSSLKFCIVAEGLADIYPRFAPTMEWDTAAGQAICEAVGLKVLDMQTNKPMLYNRENMLNNYFLVTK